MLESPTRVGQKHRRSSELAADTERRGHEYYLCPALDALEAALTPGQMGKSRRDLYLKDGPPKTC